MENTSGLITLLVDNGPTSVSIEWYLHDILKTIISIYHQGREWKNILPKIPGAKYKYFYVCKISTFNLLCSLRHNIVCLLYYKQQHYNYVIFESVMYTHAHARTHAYTNACTHAHIDARTNIYTHRYPHTYTRTQRIHIQTHTHTGAYTHILARTHTRTHTHTPTPSEWDRGEGENWNRRKMN